MLTLRAFRTGLAAVAWAAMAGAACAEITDDAAPAAFDLCRDLPEDIDAARGSLAASGWQSAEGAAAHALFDGSLAFSFDATDLQPVLSNAGFMAVSILGNSAPGSDQIGLQQGARHLAVPGIPESVGHCLITGGDDVLALLLEIDGFTELTQQSSHVLTQGIGLLPGGAMATNTRFDRAAFFELLAAIDPSTEALDWAQTNVATVTIHQFSADNLL